MDKVMNPLAASIALGLLRVAMTNVFTWMIGNGVIKDGQQEQILMGLLGLLGTLVWIVRTKIKERLVTVTAIDSPQGLTERQIEARVKMGDTPRITLGKDEVPR